MQTLSEYLAQAGVQNQSEPLWAGPEDNSANGGVTQSLLSRFLSCRERFRILTVEGLKPSDKWSHRLGYGNLWHECEREYSRSKNDPSSWIKALDSCSMKDYDKYPFQRSDIQHWTRVCRTQFQVYLDWWNQHPDQALRKPVMEEKNFSVPYTLPNGRVVYLRGKWDGVEEFHGVLWLREHKTKGDIDWFQLRRQLASGFDLQTMLYLVALKQEISDPIGGVRYNVVRRPLAGGRGTITQGKGTAGAKCGVCKDGLKVPRKLVMGRCWKCGGAGRIGAKPAETTEEFHDRLEKEIREASGIEFGVAADEHYFFQRWRIEITDKDIERFQASCLDPILDNLCWWWDEISQRENDYAPPTSHWRTPFGLWNPLIEGRETEYDQYLINGDETGLQRTDTLFPELTDA